MDSLYELTNQYRELLEWGDDPTIDEEAWLDTITAIGDEIEMKADGYAKVIQTWKGEADMLKAEIDRLTAKKRSLENNMDRLKRNLEMCMMATGKTKFKTELFSFGIQKNAPSVVIAPDVDVNAIPEEYIKKEINKSAVKDALKEGKDLHWAILQQTESIRIR